MTLEELNFAVQIVSGIAVTASLIFVGIQIRQSTHTARAQIHQNITSGWLAIVPVVTDNGKVFAAGLGASAEEFAKFSDADKLTFIGVLFGFFKHYENMYFQYQCGHIDKATWEAWSSHMFLYFRQPGVQVWWQMRKEAFAPQFRNFIESNRVVQGPRPVDVFRQRGEERSGA
jgi:hypothetical protein